jgi:hypothetical protein
MRMRVRAACKREQSIGRRRDPGPYWVPVTSGNALGAGQRGRGYSCRFLLLGVLLVVAQIKGWRALMP